MIMNQDEQVLVHVRKGAAQIYYEEKGQAWHSIYLKRKQTVDKNIVNDSQ